MKKISTILLAGSMIFSTFSYSEMTQEQKNDKAHKAECKAKVKEICKTDKEKCRTIKEKKKALKQDAKENCKNSNNKKSCIDEYKSQHMHEIHDMIHGTTNNTTQTSK